MLILNPHASAFAGCYSLHLYCKYLNSRHEFDEFPHEYTAEHGGECRKKARADGWIIHRDGLATCPKCKEQVRS